MKRISTFLILGLGLLLLLALAGRIERSLSDPPVFSASSMLEGLWHNYKSAYLDPSGRVVDRERPDLSPEITTSESQAYGMLRAVWMDDQAAFDQIWNWTRGNLRKPDSSLFAWLYGERPDGSRGILSGMGGMNSASDADTDIALALAFAYSRWQQPEYLLEAEGVIHDIWDMEVEIVNGKPVLLANDLEKESGSRDLLVNPSYFAPYAYRTFALIDPEHDWNELVDSSYDIIRRSSVLTLDKNKSANLPPDWLTIDRRTGELEAAGLANLTSNYGFEAMRLPWRLALDWEWSGEPRAKEMLSEFRFLGREWTDHGRILALYGHDGEPLADYEKPANYAGTLGYFLVTEPETGREIYDHKIQALYDPSRFDWTRPLGYYDSNWAWFGIGLYHRALPNLADPEAMASLRTGAEPVETQQAAALE